MSEINNTEVKEEMNNAQAQENTQAAGAQQTPAVVTPEQPSKGFKDKAKEAVGAVWNSKPMKFVKGATLVGLGFLGGMAVSGGFDKKNEQTEQGSNAAVCDTTATEETVE